MIVSLNIQQNGDNSRQEQEKKLTKKNNLL